MSVRSFERGAVIVESSFTVILLIMFFMGIMALGGIGYSQIVAEGMSSMQTGASAGGLDKTLGTINSVGASVSATFNKNVLNGAATIAQTAPVDPTLYYMGNSTADPYFNTVRPGLTNVVGGGTFIRASQLATAYSTRGLFDTFGNAFSITPYAADVAPAPAVIGRAFNAGGQNLQNPAIYTDRDATNWYNASPSGTVNLPPFFMTINMDIFCDDDYMFAQGPDCVNGHGRLDSYGLAEYLHSDNYPKQPGVGVGDAFEAMVLHQRCFYKLYSAASPWSLPPTIPVYMYPPQNPNPGFTPPFRATDDGTATTENLPARYLLGQNPVLQQMYNRWDVKKPLNTGVPPIPSAQNKHNPLDNTVGNC